MAAAGRLNLIETHPVATVRTIGEALHCAADRWPNAAAIRHTIRPCLSYGELGRHIESVRRSLRSHGITETDRVGVALSVNAEQGVAILSVACAAIATPVSANQTEGELRARLGSLGLKVLITDSESLVARVASELEIPILEASRNELGAVGQFQIPAGQGQHAADEGTPSGDRIAVISATSGTTSRPKLVPITHTNILARARCSVERFALTPDDRLLNPVHYATSYSLYTGLMAVLISGGSAIDMEVFQAQLFMDAVYRFDVTWSLAGPTLLSALLRHLEADPHALSSHCLRFIRAGTGHLPAEVATQLEHRLGIPILTGYGLEESGEVACNPLPPEPRKQGTVGTPSVPLRIVDTGGNDVDSPDPGEVLVRGDSVIRGYLGVTQSNTDKFTGDGWLRTGDRGFFDADGYLTITGRLKDLINRGGQSISPFEIEDVLLSHSQVSEAACFPIPHRSLGEDTAAAVVLQPDADTGESQLIEYVAAHLSPAKVPCAVVQVPELVKNMNGKVSRQQLAAELSDVILRREIKHEPPITDMEHLVAVHWRSVLGVQNVSRGDDFFRVGGDSLSAANLIAVLARELDCDLDVGVLFSHRTLRSLASSINKELTSEKRRARGEIAVHEGTTAPLSSQQRLLWFLSRLYPKSFAYNVGGTIDLAGTLNTKILLDSIEAMVIRHEVLRTSFPMLNQGPVQNVLDPYVPECRLEDFSELAAGMVGEAVRQVCDREINKPFDLATGPLLRCCIVRRSAEYHTLIIVKHHIISDLWSNGIFCNELLAIYDAKVAGKTPRLAVPERRYLDYAQWQQSALLAGQFEVQQSYWQNQMRGAPQQSRFPPDRERQDTPGFRSGRVDCRFRQGLEDELKEVAQKYSVTPYTTLLTALYVLLYRHTDQSDLVIGSPFANRSRAELANTLGMFVNTLPIRFELSSDPTLAELMARVQHVLIAAQKNAVFPFEKIVEAVNPPRIPGRNPLFQVMLVYGSALAIERIDPVLDASPGPMLSAGSMFDIELYLWLGPSGLEGRWEYDVDLYDESTVIALRSQFETVLTTLVKNPLQRVSTCKIIPDAEHSRLLQSCNNTHRRFPLHKTIHQLFEERVRADPGSVALIQNDRRASYTELDQHANRIANHLLASGIEPGDRVGLLVDRSIDAVAGLLAALKCGAVFVPIDPVTPALRIAQMMMICDMRFCITTAAHRTLCEDADIVGGQPLSTIFIDLQAPEIDRSHCGAPQVTVTGDSEAYVMFTSGSTGFPKAVTAAHRGMVNIVHWLWEAFPFHSSEVCCQRARLTFIDALWELLAPLLAGIPTVIIADEVVLDPERFVECLSAHQVSRLVLVPSLLQLLMSALPDWSKRSSTVETWFVSGEELSLQLSRKFLDAFPSAALVNLYGSTETAAIATCAVFSAADELQTATRVPIGVPVANTQVYTLDQEMRPLPTGVKGELFVGGVGLATEYIGQEMAPFVQAVDCGGPQRLYRTGDYGRWLANGNLQYLGRIDRQVKIRGIRIEPGEIEAIVSAFPDIMECAVVVDGDDNNLRLRGYYVAREQTEVLPSEMVERLSLHLPAHMMVNMWCQLEKLPRTAIGKVDHQRLLAMERKPAIGPGAKVPAATELERRILDLWSDVLGIRDIGPSDNFFDLGGHSLLAVRLISEMEHKLGYKLELMDLYRGPSVRKLVRLLNAGSQPTVADKRLVPMLPIDPGCVSTPLFCTYGLYIYYRLAKHLGPEQPTYGVYGQAEEDLLQNPTAEREAAFPGIPELAAEYLLQIRAVQPCGPYQLAGESFGGLIAYEMALQLVAAGEQVSLLAVLDMPTPAAILNKRDQDQKLADACTNDDEAERENLLGRYAGLAPVAGGTLESHQIIIRRARIRAILDYQPEAYPGTMVLFRSEESRANLSYFGDEWLGWRMLVGNRLTMHDLPGGHVEILQEPHVRELAGKLTPYLNRSAMAQ